MGPFQIFMKIHEDIFTTFGLLAIRCLPVYMTLAINYHQRRYYRREMTPAIMPCPGFSSIP
jgi:hypothetical protein